MYRSNKKQHNFNEDIAIELVKVKKHLSKNELDKSVEFVTEIEKKLSERNRLVRIADTHGWDTVQEYVGSDFACDDADASKLRQAEFRAIKKRRNMDKKPYDKPSTQTLQSSRFPGSGNLFRNYDASSTGQLSGTNANNFRFLCQNMFKSLNK